jgi:DNA-binding response OmpR family regulator
MSAKICLLDDDDALLAVLSEALMAEGFEVYTCTQTGNIISLLDEVKPDVLVLDYLLNGVNGGELCSEVKKHAHWRTLPVMILSAYPRVIHSLGYYHSDAFIAKPFELPGLISKLKELITDKQPV